MSRKKFLKNTPYVFTILIATLTLSSCEEFLNPSQELNIIEEELFDDWYEYRSIEMGMYGLQQKLVEQLVILGELRGDLLDITSNAETDLVEIYYFNISRTNKYASPTNLFKLISACNNFIRILQEEHPEVLDKDMPVTNYDRLYGEALCMRAWAYFNAVRIYGKVPFIHESLTTIDEIEEYINSSGTYTDSVYISYSRDGYYNDTVFNQPITLEKHYFDLDMVIDVFTNQLENELKAVGVNHYINNNDISWEVTIWNPWAMNALLGQMYLTQGDLYQAAHYFNQIINNSTDNDRYQLDASFAFFSWRNIFSEIDTREHIYSIWFNKTNFQQNKLQSLFEPWIPHQYMLKPSYQAIHNWETVWRNQVIDDDQANPERSEMIYAGFPSDVFRGSGYEGANGDMVGASYLYVKNGIPLKEMELLDMVYLRAEGDDRSSRAIMEDVDTIVYKYSIGKNRFDQDANFLVYRAAGIQLYLAELYVYWEFEQNDLIRPLVTNALGIVNDGSNYSENPSRAQMGIRGRVGLGSPNDQITVGNINYVHDPFTNEIIDYIDLTGNFEGKQLYLEELIMEEKARELAFEGERFYDLMRVARRRNDPSYLAKTVSAKYPAGKRDQIYNYLLDESNWYINYFQ